MIKDRKKLNRLNKILSIFFLTGIFFLVTIPLPAQAANCPQDSVLGKMGICITGFGLEGLLKVFFDVAGVVISPVAALLLQVMALFTMIAGTFLNFVIKFSIIDMGKNLPGVAINDAWKVLRDLANMSFIFILLYTSISLIIGKKSTADVRSLVVKMVIAAILINFSQFFTKIIIDASNLLALTFYNAVAPGAIANAGESTSFVKYGIANSITDVLKPQSIFELAGNLQGSKIITMGIMGSILLLACIFIFIAIAFMFLIRFALLIYVIIFSPIALVADVIPGAKDQFNKWWTTLVNQAFFPAIFFLLMWVAITVLKGFNPVSTANLSDIAGSIDNGGNVKADYGAIPLLVNYVMSIIFIVIAFMVSKSMASKAPGGVSKMVGAATGWAGASSLGMAGRFGRGTIGRGAQAIANDKDLQARALSGDMGARLKLKAAQKTAKASFDPRATGLGKTLGAGDAQKGGFAGDVKKKDEFNESIVKSLASTPTEKKANEELVKNIEGELKKAKENLEEAKKIAQEKADDVVKSSELIAAEATAQQAKTEAERANTGLETAEDAARRIADYEKARAEVSRLEKIREKEQQELIKKEISGAERDLEFTEKSLDYAKGIDKGKDRIDAALKVREGKLDKFKKTITNEDGTTDRVFRKYGLHTDRVLLFGRVKSEEVGAPDKIRKAAKGKSRAEQIAELAAAEEKEKKEKEDGGETEKKPEEKAPPAADSTK